MKETFIATEENLKEIAEKTIQALASSFTGRAKVLFLEGDLGAGKTTFTKELALVLGINKSDVHSPTFILKKEYDSSSDLFKKLIHIDAYRFDAAEEARVLRLDYDTKHHETLIVVEWPSRLGGVIDEDMTITFSVIDDEKREIAINYRGGQTVPRSSTPQFGKGAEGYFRV